MRGVPFGKMAKMAVDKLVTFVAAEHSNILSTNFSLFKEKAWKIQIEVPKKKKRWVADCSNSDVVSNALCLYEKCTAYKWQRT